MIKLKGLTEFESILEIALGVAIFLISCGVGWCVIEALRYVL